MHIKQVAIVGFASYEFATYNEDNKGSPFVADFDPKLNVIVGKNGAGKSNFLKAIRFVLHDMRSAAGLKHQRGDGHIAPSGYVQITFDNSDHVFPIDSDEVVLRRTLGMKKGEYYLNKKMTSKEDVMNLLESAGFSRSNPYYIVQQGKITALTNQKPPDRLELLKEVAGTRVYEERREESLSILESSDSKAEKILSVLSYIDERLGELEEEKNELKKYQDLDKKRRSLEFVLHDKELLKVKEKLAAIEDIYNDRKGKTAEENKKLFTLQNNIEEAGKKLKAENAEMEMLQLDRENKKKEHVSSQKKLVKMELALEEFVKSEEQKKIHKIEAESELKQVKRDIKVKSNHAKSLVPQYEKLVKEEEEQNNILLQDERRQEELETKRGRSKQFKTKAERDKHLNGQLKQIEGRIKKKEKLHQSEQKALADYEKNVVELGKQIEKQEKVIASLQNAIEESNEPLAQKKKERDLVLNEQKQCWQEQSQFKHELEQAKSELHHAKRNQETTMSKGNFHGIKAVKRIVKENNIAGYYGPVIELFECDDIFNTALEVTAGNALFNVVVDSEKTVSSLLKIMKEQNAGRVTFIPLDKLKVQNTSYPRNPSADPLVNYVKPVAPELKPVMKYIFGKTMLCKDSSSAIQISKSTELNCVMIDGDTFSHKGTLSGGYQDSRRSRINAQRQVAEPKAKKKELKTQMDIIDERVQSINKKANAISAEYENLVTVHQSKLSKYKSGQLEFKEASTKKRSQTAAIETKRNNIQGYLQGLNTDKAQKETIQKELATNMVNSLAPEEEAELNTISARAATLRRKAMECGRARIEVESEKKKLEDEVENLLCRRESELEQLLSELRFTHSESQEDRSKEINEFKHSIKMMKASLIEMDNRMDTVRESAKESETNLKNFQHKLEQNERLMEDAKRNREKIINKRSVYLKKKEENERKIRDLGSLPPTALQKYQNNSLKELHNQLQKCNEKLKDYSHVNKKAFDQFVNFSEQKETLLERKDKLDKSREAITNLIDHLDKQKDEAIQRTFMMVQDAFSEIFAQLAKGKQGQAELKMLNDENNNYVGVDIHVHFGQKKFLVSQLSGGEKSIMALALIFAIQKTDPAPFYIFDEIDQAMDNCYRTAIAERINILKENNQFIATTFHREMLEYADQYYGIKNTGNNSRIDVYPKEVAFNFLETAASE